jgi:hypothetical protein
MRFCRLAQAEERKQRGKYPSAEVRRDFSFENIIGKSEGMQKSRSHQKISDYKASVLIGRTGRDGGPLHPS